MSTNGNDCKMVNIYLYTRYERFWHWLQSALIVILLATGFETNGVYTLFGFKNAFDVHNFVGITWLIAFAFFVFWVFRSRLLWPFTMTRPESLWYSVTTSP